MRIGYLTYIIIILWSAVLGGCTTVKQTNEATESTQRFAHQTDKFHLARWDYHLDPDSKRLTIFIEGDGQAFTRTGKPSLDPTPVHPIAQQLAAMTLQSIALGRPCQFYKERDASCRNSEYWTVRRYSSEVIASYHEVLDSIRIELGIEKFDLVGFSGGAAIAVLVAAGRDDIASLTTLAGNLDHQYVNRYHGVTQMPESLNPIDHVGQVAQIPQHHYYGDHDQVVPASVAQNFIQSLEKHQGHCGRITQLSASHAVADWIEIWSKSEIAIPVCQ